MKGTRVLLVDDEGDLVFTLAERLTMRGFEVEAVTDGAEAVKRVRAATYDVAVVDVKMPGMDGLAVLRAMKEVCPDLPVILLTGHGGEDDEGQEGLRQGALTYLFKPVNFNELLQTLCRAVGIQADE